MTYDRANRLRALAATMPLEYLLLETDAPDQPDARIRGQRNEPARMARVLETHRAIARRSTPADIARRDHARTPSGCSGCRAPKRLALLFRFSSSSSALPTAANANVPVTCVAAPSPAPQSSLSAASAASGGRMPQTLPSACG